MSQYALTRLNRTELAETCEYALAQPTRYDVLTYLGDHAIHQRYDELRVSEIRTALAHIAHHARERVISPFYPPGVDLLLADLVSADVHVIAELSQFEYLLMSIRKRVGSPVETLLQQLFDGDGYLGVTGEGIQGSLDTIPAAVLAGGLRMAGFNIVPDTDRAGDDVAVLASNLLAALYCDRTMKPGLDTVAILL